MQSIKGNFYPLKKKNQKKPEVVSGTNLLLFPLKACDRFTNAGHFLKGEKIPCVPGPQNHLQKEKGEGNLIGEIIYWDFDSQNSSLPSLSNCSESELKEFSYTFSG